MDTGKDIKIVVMPKPAFIPEKIEEEKPIHVPDWPVQVPVRVPEKVEG